MKRKRGLRWLIIAGMTREQQIALIKRKDAAYSGTDFSSYSDAQVHQLANAVDRKAMEKRSGVRMLQML